MYRQFWKIKIVIKGNKYTCLMLNKNFEHISMLQIVQYHKTVAMKWNKINLS